jgi:hypothetical protein
VTYFSSARLSRPYTSQEALRSATPTSTSIAISPASSASIVMCERWLCAPYFDISFEQGHRLVAATVTRMLKERRPSSLRAARQCTSWSSRLETADTGALFRTKYGNCMSIAPLAAPSRSSIASSIAWKPAWSSGWSCASSSSMKRDMCVPLTCASSPTVMVKLPTVASWPAPERIVTG